VSSETAPMKPDELGRFVCVAPGGCRHTPDIGINADGLWVKTGQQWSSAHRDCFEASQQQEGQAQGSMTTMTIHDLRYVYEFFHRHPDIARRMFPGTAGMRSLPVSTTERGRDDMADVHLAAGGYWVQGRLIMALYRVTRDVPADEPHNDLGRAVQAGELFYLYHGATWGAVDDEGGGIALCETPRGSFFEFPESAVMKVS